MNNLSRRLERLEKRLGAKSPRWVLVIGCSDPNAAKLAESPYCKEILPGLYALPYGGPLTEEEHQKLREEHQEAAEEWE
jgi:hypothetical protein